MDTPHRLAWESLQHEWDAAYLFEHDDRPGVLTPCRAWRKDTWTVLEAAAPGELRALIAEDYRGAPVARAVELVPATGAR